MSGAPPAVLAIDVGSSRIRASLVDMTDGTMLDTQAGRDLGIGEEIDTETLWAELVEVVTAVDHRRGDLQGVALAALLGLAFIDRDGRPTHPAMTWMDARASQEATELSDALDPILRSRMGRRIAPELTLARLRWMSRHEPQSLDRTRWALSIKDALLMRLTGVAVTDETHASYSGLFDVGRRRWDADLVASGGVDGALLPHTVPAAASAGGLTCDAARALGLPEGLPCAVGGPDGTVGALGAGAYVPGVTIDIAGTTDVLVHTVGAPVADLDARCIVNAHLLPGLWTLGGPTGMTGGAIQWVSRLLGYPTVEAARRALDDGALGDRLARAPTFVPALGGSRFPVWREQDRGLLCDLVPDHGPADVFAAAQLGVACAIGDGLDALRDLGAHINSVVVAGGAARYPATLQLRSDCWGVTIDTSASHEATTLGTAILGATAARLFGDPVEAGRSLVRSGTRYVPSRARGAELADARDRWAAARARMTT